MLRRYGLLMRLSVDPESPTAPFEQVRLGIIAQVQSGELPPGTRLPTVRALAAELGLATNTVARAYRELEQDEVIETRGRAGSFVAATGDVTLGHAQAAAREYVQRVRALGFGDDEATAFVAAALRS